LIIFEEKKMNMKNPRLTDVIGAIAFWLIFTIGTVKDDWAYTN